MVRDEETAIGNLVTDAMRKRTMADAAIVGGGGIRNGIPAGPIMLGTLVNAFPFNNTVCVVRIKGSVIVEALEHGLSHYTVESGRGRFLHVSGLRYTFDPSKPVAQRVVRIEILGPDRYDPLEPERIYKVACDSFQLGGGDDFTMLKGKAESSVDLGYPIRDVVEQYVAEQSPLHAKIEGRIKKPSELLATEDRRFHDFPESAGGGRTTFSHPPSHCAGGGGVCNAMQLWKSVAGSVGSLTEMPIFESG